MTLHAVLDLIAARPLLRRKDLACRFNVTERTIDRWHAENHLPCAIYLPGCLLPFWRPCDIEEFELSRRK